MSVEAGSAIVAGETSGVAASWEILPSGRTPAVGPLLRLDKRAVPVGDIRGFVASTDMEGKTRPALALMIVFSAIGLLFLFGVIDIGTRARFLVAAILVGSVGLVAINDMTRLATGGVFRVDVLTAGGETFRHTTADVEEHSGLLSALGTIVGQNSAEVRRGEAAQGVPPQHFEPAVPASPVAA